MFQMNSRYSLGLAFSTGLLLLVLLIGLSIPGAIAQDCREEANPRIQLFSWVGPADPWDIAVSPDSIVYVTNPASDTICRYSLNGVLLGCWGGFGNDPGQFRTPQYLALGNGGRIYVSDEQSRIQVFDSTGGFLFQFGDGPLDSAPGSFSGDTGAIATDADGNLYVSEGRDTDHIEGDFDVRIQKFGPDGNFLSVFAQWTGMPPEPSCGSWSHCEDLEVGSDGSVFLLDRSSYVPGLYNRISRYSPSGSCELIWGVNGDQPGEFAYPHRLAVNAEGHIFVTDWFRIQEWDRDGNFITEFQKPQPWRFNAIDFFGDDPEFCYVTNGIGSSLPSSVNVLGPEPLALNILDSHWLDGNYELDCSDLLNLAECDGNNIAMTGVTADGVSPLLLRIDLPAAGSVRLSMNDPNFGETGGLGEIAALCGTPSNGPLTIASELVDGKNIVFATYQGPDDFNRPEVPSDIEFAGRDLHLSYELYPDQTQVYGSAQDALKILRPPMVFVHGLWDKGGSWKKYPNSIQNDWRSAKVDYYQTNGSPFEINWPKVLKELDGFFTEWNTVKRIVTPQVDLIAHSMGGLLARKIYESDDYVSGANMGVGFFNKVLFMNVPHRGSPLANAVVNLRSILASGSPLQRITARAMLWPIELRKGVDLEAILAGAIDDLSTGSSELTFEPMLLPIHAHVGVGGSDLLGGAASAVSPMASLHYLLSRTSSFPSMQEFVGIQHDFVVGRNSQEGGLYGGQPITLGHDFAGIHENATQADYTGSLVSGFLQTPTSDSSFFATGIPGGSSQATSAKSVVVPGFAGDVLELSLNAGSVTPGQTVSCSIQATGDQIIQEAYVIHCEGMVVLEAEPFSGSFIVPLDAMGNYPVAGLALLSDGTIARAEQHELTVDLGTASVDSIAVNPEALHFSNPGSLVQIAVLGYFSDGIARDIGSEEYWMQYSSFDPGVIQVSDKGLVQAMGPGETTLRVRFHEPGHYSIDVLVPVSVEDGPVVNNPPHARAGGAYSFCADRELCLDATGSYDYDSLLGDNLVFSWDLNGDGIFDDAQGSTPCTTFPSAAIPDLVGLKVTDSWGLFSVDYAEISPEFANCHDGVFICQVNEGGLPFEPFEKLEEIAHTPDGGFFALNYPNQFEMTDPEIHKFDAACGYEFTIYPDFSPSDFCTDAEGNLNIYHSLGADWELVRYSLDGTALPSISMDSIVADMAGGLIGIDGSGDIYSSHGLWEGSPFGPTDTFLDRYDSQGHLLQSTNLDDLLGVENSTLLCVADTGDFFAYGEHQLTFVQRNNDEYLVGETWGEEGDSLGQFGWVRDVAVGPEGVVYVGESNRIQCFSSSGAFLGQRTGSGGTDSPSTIDQVERLTVNDSGNIFVATHFPPTVQVFRFNSAGVSSIWQDDSITDQPTNQHARALVLLAPNLRTIGSSQNIEFSVGQPISRVRLRIFDLRGRLVRDLNLGPAAPGHHEAVWDTRDRSGAQVGSGIYLLRLEGDGFVATGKTVLVR